MALETATYVDALVTSNPDGTDQRATADDHLRLIKAALKRSFPMIGGAVSASAAAITHVNDLSAGVQAQLNALRDGSATAKYALVATSAVSASDAVALGGLSAGWYARLDQRNVFENRYQTFTHPDEAYHVMAATDAASGERAWIANYVAYDGTFRVATAGDSGTFATTVVMFTRVGTAPESAYFYGSGSIYWNGNDLANPTQMNGVAAAAYARLDAAQTFQKGTGSVPVAVGYTSTVTLNCEDGNVHRIVLTGNMTLGAPIVARPGQVIVLILVQGGTGSNTVTWNSVFRFAGGSPPVLSTAAGAVDVFSFVFDNAVDNWLQAGLDVKR